jgi:DNA-binding NtrC family response regulator
MAIILQPRCGMVRRLDPPGRPLRTVREEAERRHILATLRLAKGNRAQAARMLGISRKTLWKSLKRLGVTAPARVTER